VCYLDVAQIASSEDDKIRSQTTFIAASLRSISNRAIFSNDPEASEKLIDKRERFKKRQNNSANIRRLEGQWSSLTHDTDDIEGLKTRHQIVGVSQRI